MIPRRDSITDAQLFMDYAHHEAHAGSRFYVQYSVASLGAMTSPNDTITLTFKTPNTTKWGHFTYTATGTSGWRIRLIEAPTGAAITPTGTLAILNHNRNSVKTSVMTIKSGATAGVVDYDSTLATGGTTLIDSYIEGSTSGQSGSGAVATRDEIILKQNTVYQLSMFGTDTDPGTLYMDWYEHTNRN